jgi:Tol biopolymer transport system component
MYRLLISSLTLTALALALPCCSDDDPEPKETTYGPVEVTGTLSWDASSKTFSAATGKADAPVNLLTDSDEGIKVDLLDSLVLDKVVRLKTQITNLKQPVDEMVDVSAKVTKIEGQSGATSDDPWRYGTIQDGLTSDTVEWRFSGLDSTKPFTIHFTISWRRDEAYSGSDELVITGDYGNAYYLVDPEAKTELAKIDPFDGKTQPVKDVTLGFQGERIYFASKAPGVAGYDLYGTDTMTGKNTKKLTSLKKKALQNPDANPKDSRIVFEADVDSKPRIFLMQDESSTPVQISGDEEMMVPHADDPTVSWGDREPSWSPDGTMIVYARSSKDTKGSSIPMVRTVVVMNADGSGKVPLHGEVGGAALVNICWTPDSAFLIFTVGPDMDKNKKIYAVHQRSGTLSDLTASFAKDPHGLPANHSCSPSALAIVYAPVEVNPDLYRATFKASGNKLTLDKVELMAKGQHFREPDWARYRRGAGTDVVGSYSSKLPAAVIATADYANRYYLVDPASGVELLSVSPGLNGVYDVSLGASGKRAFFTNKPTGNKGPELYACDTLTGANVKKLTSFNMPGLANPDASPTTAAVVFEAVKTGGIPNLYTIASEGSAPVKISGDEQLTVPEADDPTVSWGDRGASWSPDGKQIVYNRASKDTTGTKIPLVNAVVVMNADGSSKQAIWGAASGGPTRPCWTSDGQFVIFTQGALYARDKKVFAVHVSSLEISDLTASFSAHAMGAPATLWCSPTGTTVVYAPIEVNPDLYTATLTAAGNKLSVGTIKKLTKDLQHYRDPDWASISTAAP